MAEGNKINVLSELLGRAQLASKMGMQFGGDRDIYNTLGYSHNLTYKDFYAQYSRQDIAAAIIDRPVDATWSGPLDVLQADDIDETAFEKAWRELQKRLSLKSKFVRLDKLTSLGHYGVLLLGLSDVKNKQSYAQPVRSKNLKLNYVKPLGEGSAQIASYIKDPSDERYGLPEFYDVTIQDKHEKSSHQLRVHHSRVIHVAADLMESEVEGIPVLKKVYNRLKDLEKLVGGSAEMFWKGARPGYQGKTDKDFKVDDKLLEDIKEQVDEYEHGLRRILINEGIDLKGLEMQIADPKGHVEVQIQMISAVTGIPKRILTGSEQSELASSQDKSTWLSLVQDRRTEYAEQLIVIPFINRCMALGVLPQVDNYNVKWKDLFAPSEKEQADVGKVRAGALKEYVSSPQAEMVVPPQAFFEYFLGLDASQVSYIKEIQEQAIIDEERAAQSDDYEEPDEDTEE